MVSTRGEMEARLEFLERAYHDYMKTRDEVQDLRLQLETEKIEAQRRINELQETVRGLTLTHSSPSQEHHQADSNNGYHTEQRAPEERWRKLSIPIFDGDDAFGWINRVERYFDLKGVLDEEKLQPAMVAMEGKALTWYQWWEFCSPNQTWSAFKEALLKRFQPSMLQSPYELLMSLKQIGSVELYREQFELYAGPLRSAEPEYLKGIFLSGLQDVIKAELKLHPVGSLPELMDYAQRIDEKNMLLTKGSNETGSIGRTMRTSNKSKTANWESENKSHVQTNQSGVVSSMGEGVGNSMGESDNSKTSEAIKGQMFKKLTDAEIQDKRVKGLCFRCDEKFSPGHRCPNKQLRIMIMAEEDYKEEKAEEGMTEFKFWDPGGHLCNSSP